jgi:Asp-tRNA(Asn)/Glu-tRNA(Gln) amidotransferase A subunit family amidase
MQIKSEDLIFAYINRIRSVQPLVNAVVAECYEQAIEDARKVDQYLANLDENSEEYRNVNLNSFKTAD